MKKITVTLIAILTLLVSFSIASAGPDDNSDTSWQQEFAVEAESLGLEQAIKNARAEGKTVSEIINASLAAGFGDYVITVALINAGTGRKDIMSAAAEAGMSMQIVIAALAASDSGSDKEEELGFQATPSQALSHPSSPIGGAGKPSSASPSTF